MVATEPEVIAPRWSSADLRAAVNWMVVAKGWSLNAIARELILPADQLTTWLDSDETTSAKFRIKLHRLINTFGIPHPGGEEPVEGEPVPLPAPDPEPLVVSNIATFPPPSGVTPTPEPDIFRLDGPLPFGFAMLVPPPLPSRGHPAAIVLRETCVALSKPLRAHLGSATHLLIGIESRTDVSPEHAGIAIAIVSEDSPYHEYALPIPKNGEWAATIRNSLGLPNGVYVAAPDDELPGTWVCRRVDVQ